MGLTLITPATDYPVTLAEAKAQCRVDSSDEDALLNGLIAAATNHVEEYLGRALMTQTWRLTSDEFSDSMLLRRGPVQSVTSLKYYDIDGVLQTVSTDDYTPDLSHDPQWIVKNTNATWPATLDAIDVVQITFVSGYAILPAAIKQAVLLLIGQWFDQRSDVTERPMIAMPNAVEALLSNHRSFAF